MAEIPYSFCIQTDTGITLFQQQNGLPGYSSQTFSLMQAFLQTTEEMNGIPFVIQSEDGVIAFTSMNFQNDNQLLLFLTMKRLGSTLETSTYYTQRILYHLRNMIILQIGIKDFDDDLSKNIYDRLKKQMKILSPKLNYIFGTGDLDKKSSATDTSQLPMIQKFELLYSSLTITSHSSRNDKIITLFEKIKDKFNIQHMCLWLKDKVYLCTKGWSGVHEADKLLLKVYKEVHSDPIICDVPLYLTHTSLIEDMSQLGKIPYRYIIMQISDLFSITLVLDPSININDLYDFVKKSINKEMSIELNKKQNMETIIEMETPANCLYWCLIDHKQHVIRSFASQSNYAHHESVAMGLYLQMPVVKDQNYYQQMNQMQNSENEIAYQQYIYAEENKYQLFRLRDKGDFELVMLFEKEINSNLVAKGFYKKLMELIGEKDKYKFDYIL